MNQSRLVLTRSIATLIALSSTGLAASWTGATSNDWNTGTNWDTGLVPNGVNAYIGITGGANPPYTATISADIPALVDLQVARTGGPAILNHTAGTAATGNNNWIDVGTDGGTGTYNLANTNANGGTLTGFGQGSGTVTGYRLYVGGVDFGGGGGVGTVNINTTGSLNTANDFLIGVNHGTGVVNLDSGTINTGTGGGWNFIGTAKSSVGGHGTLNMSGGTVNNVGNGRTYVGDGNAWGEITMSGGTYNNNLNGTADMFTVGSNNLANANTSTVSMTGGTINANGFFVGGNNDGGGKGAVTLNAPTALLNAGGETWIGDNANSNGRLDLTAGTFQAGNWFAVGRAGATGVVNMSGGTLSKLGANNNHIIVGSLGGNGTFNQTGGDVNSVGHGEIRLGEGSSTALWDLSGGTVQTDGTRIAWSGGTNELRVRGTGSFTTGFLNVGEGANNGTGTVTQTAGTVTSNSWIAVGLGSSAQAKYNISGGTINAGGFEVGADSSGLVALSGSGIININGNVEVPTRNGSGTLNITGGTLNTVGFQQGGRDGQVGTGVTTQSAGLVKVSSDFVVQRANVGTGTYTLSGGTLSVDGVVDLSRGTFTFNGGTLTRSNTGVINVSGSLTTGAGAATLKLDADKTFFVSGVLNDIAGLTLAVNGLGIPDQTGPVTSPVTGSFSLGTAFGGVPVPDHSFDIGLAALTGFDPVFNISGAGNFTAARINETSSFDAFSQSVYWIEENGGTVTLEYSIIPEPGTTLLLLVGGVFFARRRRRN